jgi:hypothetical protein
MKALFVIRSVENFEDNLQMRLRVPNSPNGPTNLSYYAKKFREKSKQLTFCLLSVDENLIFTFLHSHEPQINTVQFFWLSNNRKRLRLETLPVNNRFTGVLFSYAMQVNYFLNSAQIFVL